MLGDDRIVGVNSRFGIISLEVIPKVFGKVSQILGRVCDNVHIGGLILPKKFNLKMGITT